MPSDTANCSLCLRASDLYKHYNNRPVVRGLSLSLCPGEVLGLVGPNGAGKTTAIGMLYGAVIPDRGDISLGPWDVRREGRRARRELGVVTQEDNLDPDLTVVENLVFFSSHFGLPAKRIKTRIEEMLNRVGLWQYRDYAIEDLSGGLKRRLVLARALLHQPKFLFLDEPTTGLDPDARQAFWKLILELRDEGHALLLTTHYMEESERLCSRIALLREGVIVDQGSPSELIQRVAGKEAVEVEGLNDETIQSVLRDLPGWRRPVGSGVAFCVPASSFAPVLLEIERLRPSRIVRRRANLDDVFFLLTGEPLEL